MSNWYKQNLNKRSTSVKHIEQKGEKCNGFQVSENRRRSIQYESVPQPCVEARDHCISLHLDKRIKSHDLGGEPRHR